MKTCIEELNRPPYPRNLILDIHSFCNAKCQICPYSRLRKKLPMGVMEEDLFTKIVDDYSNLTRKYNCKGNINFCNMGELFVREEAIDRIQYVLKSGLAMGIQTNGSLFSPRYVDELINMGFDGPIVVSCHGISPDVYNRIMGLNLAKTLENIDYLTRRYPKEKIHIQAIPHRWPKGESRRVRKYWKTKGVSVRFPLPCNRAGLVLRPGNKRRLVGCNGRPLGDMVICFTGDVVLCCNDMSQQEIVGSLKANTIEEVWNGKGFIDRIEQIYCGKPSREDFICRQCDFAKTSETHFSRAINNLRYELRKFYLTYLW